MLTPAGQMLTALSLLFIWGCARACLWVPGVGAGCLPQSFLTYFLGHGCYVNLALTDWLD